MKNIKTTNSIIVQNMKKVRLAFLQNFQNSTLKHQACLLIILFFSLSEIKAATITSTGSGNWNSTTANAPWPSGIVPAVGDIVIIANTHTVNLTVAVTKTAGTVTVSQGGTLNLNASLTVPATAAAEITVSGTLNINAVNGLLRTGNAGAGSNAVVTATGIVDITTSAATENITVWDLQTGSTLKLSALGAQTLDPDFVGAAVDNLTLSGSGAKTLGENTTVSQVLSLEGTASLLLGGFTLTYGANSTLQYKGSATVTATTNEFPNAFAGTGGLIIDQGAGNSVVLNANKTALSLINIKSGNLDLNTFTANRAAAGGSLTIAANAGLIIGGTNTLPTNFSTHSINCNSTINYSGTNQTIANLNSSQTYGNLTLSGSGTKTMQVATTTICNNFTLAGTAITTAVIGLTIGGNVTLGTGTSFNAATFTHALAGNWTNNGGTFTTGTSTISFTGNSSAINGTAATQTFNNLTVNKSVGQTLSVSGTTNTLNINGIYTQSLGNFSAPATMSVTGNSILTAGTFTANTNLNLTGNFTNNGATFTAGSGTVSMNGSGFAIGGSATTTFNNLTINNAGGTTLGNSIAVNNVLTLSSGNLTIGTNNLTLGTGAVAGAPFSNTKMIVASSTGQVRKLITSTPITYTFPIGDNTLGADYSPIDITLSSATLAGGALIAVNVTDAKHPNDGSTNNYISRYWTINQANITDISAAITGTFVAVDVFGSSSNIITSRYIAPTWVEQNVATATTISATNLVAFGDFTGRNNLPVITVNPTTLSGFIYMEGNGPSADQSFTVSGSALTTNITILPSASFEISSGTGAAFVPATILTAIVVNREVPATTFYVRLKAGLNVGTVSSQNVTCSSTGVTTVNVTCSGSVTDAPLISPTITTLSNFTYSVGAGPSTAQTFNVNGANLSANITATAPTNYEISLSATSGYGASLSLGAASTPIYVRLKAGLLFGDYVGNITFTSTNAVTKTVTCTGKVNNPTVAVSKLSLAGFIYAGAGPSEVQSVNVSGTFLAVNLVVTPPTTEFEISTSPSSGFSSNAISLAPTSGTVASTPIYVRMKSGLGTGIKGPQNIVVTSGSAISQNVACSGQVVTGATTISSNGVLNGFFYVVNRGPSLKQNFTVSATSLTDSVTVTPPTNFEISPSGVEGTFVSSTSTRPFFRIAQIGGKINAIPVYVRLKAGYPVGTYNTNQNIVLSSTGAQDVNVVCNGTVVSQPTIVAGPTGLENLCPVNNVTLTSTGTNITSQTWTGPNGFTSTAQNPVLGTVTAAQNGTYTVSSSIKSNINLLTNGDFSAGNTNFGSSYKFWPYGTQSYLQNQYTIGPNPTTLNNGFCNQPTGRAGTGGNQMIIDGATLAAGGAGAIAWSQSIEIEEGATYQFSYWVQNIWPASPAILQFYIDGVPTGSVHNVTATTCSWVQVVIPYINTGSTRIVQLSLVDLNLEPQGNDFALDDFEFQLIFNVSSSVNLTVNPTLSPSLQVTASNNPVFSNTIVTYTATPTNGGTTPSYQWKVNGVNFGTPTTNTTIDYTPINGDIISCILTSTYPCASPQTATSQVVMTVNPRSNYWRGNISTNWGTPGNWTGGFVPAPGDDVEFAKKSNNNGVPAESNLQLDINRTIGFLVNDSANLSVIIPPNLTLIVNNNIQSTSNTDKILIQASASLPNGSIIYRNPQNLPVYGTVEMYSPASWNKSNAINNRYNWQFFGIPVSTVDALPTFYGAYVRELFENDNDTATHWRMLTNTSVLQPFKGYELCQQAPAFYTFRGQLVNSNFQSGQFIKSTGALYPGQHMYANPYTSAMDIRQIEFGTGVEATAYLYNTGTFTSWKTNPTKNVDGTVIVPGQYNSVPKQQAGDFGILRQIPSMGSIMVRILKPNASTTNSYVNFTYNSVAMGNTDRQRAKAQSLTDTQAVTEIQLESDNGFDKLWIMSHDQYTRNFDNGFDGIKLTGNALNQQIYAVETDGNYQINSVNDINNTSIAFQAGVDENYILTFMHNENSTIKYKKIFLHDLVENQLIDITTSGTKYAFNASSTPNPVLRFKILSQNESIDSEKVSFSKVYHFDNKLYIQNFSENEGKVFVYDISGRMIGIKTISANQNIQLAAPKNNTYIVKVVIGNTTETSKIFLQ
ncbi:MAG: hypothetical protein ACOYM7_01065 [Paludibacter sp.]